MGAKTASEIGAKTAVAKMEYHGWGTQSKKMMGFSSEIVFILLLALILFGPRRLPEIARQIGKFMAEFRRASGEFQNQIHAEIRKLELDEADPRKHLAPVVHEVNKAVGDADDVSLSGALNRLTERIKNSVAQDTDA